MSKIDVSKIEGYESMTPEEQVKALLEYEIEEPNMDGFVTKKSFDELASKYAKKKKELAEKMTEDEAKALADKETLESMQKELAELRKKEKVSENAKKLLALGYDETLANSSATALADNDMETFFKNQKIHQENQEKKYKSELLLGTKKPEGGSENPGGAMTKESLRKLSVSERAVWATQHPEEYKAIYGGN